MTDRAEALATIPAQWEQRDDRFAGIGGDRRVLRLATDCRWAEGPVYVPAGRYLLWSDIPNDQILRWDELTGSVGVFRTPANYPNGHTLDREGRLISCEHGARRVTRTEHDGTVTVLVDGIDGHRLNSPNDVVVRSDGSIWFTDPSYGITSDYEGFAAEPEVGCHVYRIDPATGACAAVVTDFDQPNGLAFSLDESQLYVADSARRHIRVFDIERTGTLSGGEVLIDSPDATPDGFRLDNAGRIWAGVGASVSCYAPDGTQLGKLIMPETVANVCFGGAKRNVLFACATTSVYALMLKVTGAPPVYCVSS